MVAGEYWIIKKLTGWTLKEHPFGVVRIILFTINLVPFFIYLLVFWALLQRFSQSDWACIYALTIAALGTSVLPFLNSFNNHTMATFSILFAIYGIVRIQEIADAKSKTPGKDLSGSHSLACFVALLFATNYLRLRFWLSSPWLEPSSSLGKPSLFICPALHFPYCFFSLLIKLLWGNGDLHTANLAAPGTLMKEVTGAFSMA